MFVVNEHSNVSHGEDEIRVHYKKNDLPFFRDRVVPVKSEKTKQSYTYIIFAQI